MKAILEFNLPEEREEHEDALNGVKYKCQLDEIWDKVWRPYLKHGYSNSRINELLQKEECEELFNLLMNLYREQVDDI